MADDMTDEMKKAIEFNRRRFDRDRKEIKSLQERLEEMLRSRDILHNADHQGGVERI